MRFAIVMPVWLQEPVVLEMTKEAVASICAPIGTKLIVVPTRLRPELITQEELARTLHAQVPWQPGQDLSVAAAWNLGVKLAGNVDRIMLMANDTKLLPDCISKLLAYSGDADLWSGRSVENSPIPLDTITEGPDFNVVMFKPSLFEKYGTFDERFRPAYFEDSDYHVRIVQGGGNAVCVHAARFYHRGSATIGLDPEARHHNRHWFETNRSRYKAKWGPSEGPPTEAAIRERCYKHPWNDRSLPVSFWDRD